MKPATPGWLLSATWELFSLSPVLPVFEQFSDYIFSDPARSSEGIQLDLGEKETDAGGLAVFALNLHSY
jgi:hypothetical protein